MLNKITAVLFGCFSSIFIGALYYLISNYVFYETFPVNVSYVSMSLVSWVGFLITLIIDFLVIILMRKKHRIFANSYFITALVIHIAILIILSNIRFYF